MPSRENFLIIISKDSEICAWFLLTCPTLGHNYCGSRKAAAQRIRAIVTQVLAQLPEFRHRELQPGDLFKPGIRCTVTRSATAGSPCSYQGSSETRGSQSHLWQKEPPWRRRDGTCVPNLTCGLRIKFFMLLDILKIMFSSSHAAVVACQNIIFVTVSIDRPILHAQIIVEFSLNPS